MPEMINVEEARAYALKRWPSPVVRRSIEALLDDCPRAAESVRHGKWLDKSMDYYCSECGTSFHDELFWIQGDCITPNYCPHCGAKMDAKDGDRDA